MSGWIGLAWALALWATPTRANYRQFHVDNADLCNSGSLRASRTLDLGTGAAIFKLSVPSIAFQPNYHNKAKRCQIHVKAPEGHGLVAYVEEMYMRRSSKDTSCVDYVQFGQDDILPFVTVEKSERLCGQRYGHAATADGEVYDDPSGSLLIWVSLGGRRQTSSWPQISVVNLTLVVTSYQKNCVKPHAGFKRCGSRDRCIWQHYFCDRHFNCASDIIPADEDGCQYDEASPDQPEDGLKPNESEDNSAVNAITWTLIIVCVCILILVSANALVQYRRTRKCCTAAGATSDPGSCEQPSSQAPRSLVELNRQRHLRESEANIYLPLTAFTDYTSVQLPPAAIEESRLPNVTMGGLPVGEEPPPAYEELFPIEDPEERPLNPDAGPPLMSEGSLAESLPEERQSQSGNEPENSQTSLRQHLSETMASSNAVADEAAFVPTQD